MRKQIKQGISVVLSAAMILSFGGNVRGAYAAETTGSGESRIEQEVMAEETKETETREKETEEETLPAETAKEETEEETSPVETAEDMTKEETSPAETTEDGMEEETSATETESKQETAETTAKETAENDKKIMDLAKTAADAMLEPRAADVSVTTAAGLKTELEKTAYSSICVDEDITLTESVTMGANHSLKVAAGKKLIITGGIATGSRLLTLTGTETINLQGNGTINGRINIESKVVVDGNSGITAGDITIKSGGEIQINSSAGIQVNAGAPFKVESGGKLRGGTNGGIILTAKAKVTDANGSNIFSDQGKTFTTTSQVTVGDASVDAANDQLTAGTYTWNGSSFAKPAPPPPPKTNLTNGILTLSDDAGGSNEAGWTWDPVKNVLNINSRFKDIKQIRFINNAAATMFINADNLSLNPDPGQEAIIANNGLTISARAARTLTVKGPINVEGALTVTNYAGLNLSGSAQDALMSAKGLVKFEGNAAVTVNNTGGGSAIQTSGAFSTRGNAKVKLTAKGSNPTLQADGEINMTNATEASLTVVNEGTGAVMNKAPKTTGYPNALTTASTSSSGKPAAEYNASNISNYKYLKIRKNLTFSNPPTAAEVESAADSVEPDDYVLIDAIVEALHALDGSEMAKVQSGTITKLDQMLQSATGISPRLDLSISDSKASRNQQIKYAQIDGALIALGIKASATGQDIVFRVEQIEKAGDAYTTFVCSLTVNGKPASLKLPVNVKVELPPEYYPFGGDQLLTGSGQWLDFTYFGGDNTATFRTSSLGTFSLIRKAGSKKSVSSSSGGHSRGGGGGGGGASSGATTGATTGTTYQTGTWIQDSVGWWYQYADKTYPANGWFQLGYKGKWDWYYFNKDGYMVTGWVRPDGKNYYLNPISNGSQGKMLTGWQIIDGKWYYFNEKSDGTKGAMITDTWIGDIYVGSDGIWDKTKKK